MLATSEIYRSTSMRSPAILQQQWCHLRAGCRATSDGVRQIAVLCTLHGCCLVQFVHMLVQLVSQEPDSEARAKGHCVSLQALLHTDRLMPIA